jgi:hypothetical protein
MCKFLHRTPIVELSSDNKALQHVALSLQSISVFWKDTLDIIFDIAATAAVMETDLNNKDYEHSLNKTKVIFPGTLSLSVPTFLQLFCIYTNSSTHPGRQQKESRNQNPT